jgi:hypothetical protein
MGRLADPCQVTADPFDEKSFDEKVGRHSARLGFGARMRRVGKMVGGLRDTPNSGVPPKLTVTLPTRRIRGARRGAHT